MLCFTSTFLYLLSLISFLHKHLFLLPELPEDIYSAYLNFLIILFRWFCSSTQVAPFVGLLKSTCNPLGCLRISLRVSPTPTLQSPRHSADSQTLSPSCLGMASSPPRQSPWGGSGPHPRGKPALRVDREEDCQPTCTSCLPLSRRQWGTSLWPCCVLPRGRPTQKAIVHPRQRGREDVQVEAPSPSLLPRGTLHLSLFQGSLPASVLVLETQPPFLFQRYFNI